MLKLRKLRIARAVAEGGSLMVAALQLGLSQPAVSRAIQSLERDIGTPLFLRSVSGAIPTQAGAALVSRFERALGHLRQAGQALNIDVVLHEQTSDHEFRALIGIGETGSVLAAAGRDGVTPQAVLKSLRMLEARTHMQLVQRSTGGDRLTLAGETIMRRAKLAFAEIAHAMDDIASQAEIAGGRLRIGALPLTRPRLLPTMVEAVLSRFPAAEIAIIDGTYGALLSGLRQGDIDLIVGTIRDAAQTPDVTSQVLFEDNLVIATRPGHPLAQVTDPHLDQCLAYDWVLPFKDVPLRMQFEASLARANLTRSGRAIETDSLIVLRSLLRQSDRLAVVSRQQVMEEVRLGHLAVLPLKIDAPPRQIGLVHLDAMLPTALIAAAMEELRIAANQLQQGR